MGLYSAYYALKTVLLERMASGRQIITAEHIENYPGLPGPVRGFDLCKTMASQATGFGLEGAMVEVEGCDLSGKRKVLMTVDGNFLGRAVIIATGAKRRKLGLSGEDAFEGRGISFRASCDGEFFRG